MKKIIPIGLSLLLTMCTIPIYAGSVDYIYISNSSQKSSLVVSSENITSKEGNLQVTGSIPIISDNQDLQFSSNLELELKNKINRIISDIKSEKIQKGIKNSTKKLKFSYETKNRNSEVYILLYSTFTTGADIQEVDVISFDLNTGEVLTIEDFLGVNAVDMCNKYISDKIKKNPENYNTNFKGITKSQDFYIDDNNNCILLFNEYEIAPGYVGLQKISINLDKIYNIKINKSNYKIKSEYSLKMLPLRQVCEGLGYTVDWDSTTNSTKVTKGNFSTHVSLGKNSYTTGLSSPKQLESKPEIIEEKTFVPISFFEVILGASYSINTNGDITFSQYLD